MWRETRAEEEVEIDVQWMRSHPERRERNRDRWTAEEWGNWAADWLAGSEDQEMGAGRWTVSRVSYSDAVEALHLGDKRGSEVVLRWQSHGDQEVEMLGEIRRTMRKLSLERNWETYLRNRDGVSRRGRRWAHLQWRLAHQAWAKRHGRGSAAGRLTKLLWVLDQAPTSQRKTQRGYEEVDACACGQERPDRTHVLLDCELTKVHLEPLRHEITRAFTAIAVTASRQERVVIEEIRQEVLAWLSGGITDEERDVAEDFLCGLWSARVSEQIAGEVEYRVTGGEAITLRRELLVKMYEGMRKVLGEATMAGWEAWKMHNEQRKAAAARERRGLRGVVRERRRIQRAEGQQDIRLFMLGEVLPRRVA